MRLIGPVEIDNNHGKLIFQLAHYEHPFTKKFPYSDLPGKTGTVRNDERV